MKPAPAPRVRALSLVQQIHATVSRLIDDGSLAPGQPVNIAELARQHGVSPTPVREALARLAAEGTLLFTVNIGYRVPPLPAAQDYQDWALARLVVEAGCLEHILGPIDPRVLAEAEAINARIAAEDFGTTAAGIRRFSELNWRFHACLVALARNPMLDELHARLYRSPEFSRIFLGRGVVHQARVAAEHAAVLRALHDGEPRAATAALRVHIVDSLERDARLSALSVPLRRLAAGDTTGDPAAAPAPQHARPPRCD